MRVFIGYDPREDEAARVALKSLRAVSGLEAELLRLPKLVDHGLITRPVDHRGGRDYDLVSNAHAATRFALTRFLTPMLCQEGYCLFTDCDMVFLRDPREMLREVRSEHAVSVVKHDHRPAEVSKMCGQEQSVYARKNWSSVMLFNCDHPANRRLSLRDVNERPGLWLHQFGWLHDSEIGELDPCWNYLVDVQDPPPNVGIVHMTLGGPWLPGWQGGSWDDLWLKAANS